MTKEHRGHVCDLVIDVYDKCMTPVHDLLDSTEDQVGRINTALQSLAEMKTDLNAQCDIVEQQVNDAADEMMLRVSQDRQRLLDHIEQSRQVKSDTISRKEKKALQIKKSLKKAISAVKRFLQDNSQIENLTSRDRLLNHLNFASKDDKMELLKPGEKLELRFISKEPPEVSLGKITTNLPPQLPGHGKIKKATIEEAFKVSPSHLFHLVY